MNNNFVIIDILGDISLARWNVSEAKAVETAMEINSFFEKADYRIANFESPVVLNAATAINKSGPNLKTDKKYISFFEKLCVDGYTMANNHLGDYGITGVKDTIDTFMKLDKDYVGISLEYPNIYKPLRKEIKGINVSIFSVCENEFGVRRNGQIGTAGYNEEILKELLSDEKEWADFQIVIFHGGCEYNPFPSPELRQRYHELVDWGANAVVGMHTHCPQGYEIYQNAPVIYSVGNFFFPRESETPFEAWKFGYIAKLTLRKSDAVKVNFIPYMFDTYGQEFKLIEKSIFINYLDEISDVIQNAEQLENLYKAWAIIHGKSYLNAMYKNLGNLDDKKKLAVVKNMFSCEAHNELIKTYLNILYDDEVEKNYIYVDEIKQYMRIYDRFFRINTNENCDEHLSENKVIIWGVGEKAEILYKEMKNKGKKCVFVDKNVLKQQMNYLGEYIISPEEALCKYKGNDIYICTSEKSAEEIKRSLNDKGIKNVHVM